MRVRIGGSVTYSYGCESSQFAISYTRESPFPYGCESSQFAFSLWNPPVHGCESSQFATCGCESSIRKRAPSSPFPAPNSHIRKSKLRTLTSDVPLPVPTLTSVNLNSELSHPTFLLVRRLSWPHCDVVPLLQAFLIIWPVRPSSIQFLTSERIHHAATLYNL